jgi:hypothetical protein
MVGAPYEPFDYADGTQFPTTSTVNGGYGFNANGDGSPNQADSAYASAAANTISAYGGAGNLKTAKTGSLDVTVTGYPAETGGRLNMDASVTSPVAGTQNMARLFRPTGVANAVDTGTLYFSFLIRRNNDTFRTTSLGFFGPATGVAPSTVTERFSIGQIGVAGAAGQTNGNFGVLVNNNNPASPAANSILQGTTAVGTGVTHLIVGRVDFAAGLDRLQFWVDPSNVTTEAAAGLAYIDTSAFELTSVSTYRPFAGAAIATLNGVATPQAGASTDYDEIRLAGTWDAAIRGIPEPTSALLFALSGLALGAFRKRS